MCFPVNLNRSNNEIHGMKVWLQKNTTYCYINSFPPNFLCVYILFWYWVEMCLVSTDIQTLQACFSQILDILHILPCDSVSGWTSVFWKALKGTLILNASGVTVSLHSVKYKVVVFSGHDWMRLGKGDTRCTTPQTCRKSHLWAFQLQNGHGGGKDPLMFSSRYKPNASFVKTSAEDVPCKIYQTSHQMVAFFLLCFSEMSYSLHVTLLCKYSVPPAGLDGLWDYPIILFTSLKNNFTKITRRLFKAISSYIIECVLALWKILTHL